MDTATLLNQFDEYLQLKQELTNKQSEERKLKYIAERNKIIPPSFIDNIHSQIEALAPSIDNFSTSIRCESLKEQLEDPGIELIPCPISKRKEMLQAFENLENINSRNISLERNIATVDVENYLNDSAIRANHAIANIEELITDAKNASETNDELLSMLEEVKEQSNDSKH